MHTECGACRATWPGLSAAGTRPGRGGLQRGAAPQLPKRPLHLSVGCKAPSYMGPGSVETHGLVGSGLCQPSAACPIRQACACGSGPFLALSPPWPQSCPRGRCMLWSMHVPQQGMTAPQPHSMPMPAHRVLPWAPFLGCERGFRHLLCLCRSRHQQHRSAAAGEGAQLQRQLDGGRLLPRDHQRHDREGRAGPSVAPV